MFLHHNLVADRQPQTGTFAHRFSSKKGSNKRDRADSQMPGPLLAIRIEIVSGSAFFVVIIIVGMKLSGIFEGQ